MSIVACPTDVVAAPVERIWELLVDAPSIARWTDTRLLEGPGRPLQAGDRIVYGAGPGMRAIFDVLDVVPRRTLGVDVTLPFGIVAHEIIQLTALDGGRTRVTFN